MSQHHEDICRHSEVRGPSNRQFGVVIGGFLALLAFAPLLHRRTPHWALAAIAVAVLLVTAVAPSALSIPNRLWMRLSMTLAKVVNPVVLSLIFYVFVTPLAMLLKVMGKDVIERRIDSRRESYWVPRTSSDTPAGSMARPF
jgi:hypothetical protein